MPVPIIAVTLLATTTAGTTITAARRAYKRRIKRRLSKSSPTPEPSHQEIVSSKVDQEEIDHFFSANSLSLGMTMGGLVFPPLMIASVPLNIYTTLPTIKEAMRTWSEEKRISSHTLESTLVVGTLLTQHWLSAATIAWTYSFGRKVKTQLKGDLQQAVESAMQPSLVWTELDGNEIQIPLDAIESGDIVVISENSFVPLSGHITKGEATINTYFSTMNTEPVEVRAGDSVPPMAFVITGKISIEVVK